jgi:hypothetical protein
VSWPRWPELGRLGRRGEALGSRPNAPVIEHGECAKLRRGRAEAIGLYRYGPEEGTWRT